MQVPQTRYAIKVPSPEHEREVKDLQLSCAARSFANPYNNNLSLFCDRKINH